MPHSLKMTFQDLERITDSLGRPLMETLAKMQAAKDDFIEAWTAAGASNQAWANYLFRAPRVEGLALSITAATATIAGPAGSAAFAAVPIGRSIDLAGFTNGGNNTTKIVATKPNADSVTVTSGAGLVDETGNGDETCQVLATAAQVAIVADYIAFWQEVQDIIDFYEGTGVPAQQDRRPAFQRVLSL